MSCFPENCSITPERLDNHNCTRWGLLTKSSKILSGEMVPFCSEADSSFRKDNIFWIVSTWIELQKQVTNVVYTSIDKTINILGICLCVSMWGENLQNNKERCTKSHVDTKVLRSTRSKEFKFEMGSPWVVDNQKEIVWGIGHLYSSLHERDNFHIKKTVLLTMNKLDPWVSKIMPPESK